MVTPDVMKMSVNREVTFPRFLMHYFNSNIARRFSSGSAFGTTRLRLTLPIFRSMPVPLPPLVEQEEILFQIERLISIEEQTRLIIEEETKRIQRMHQAILKQAFEGKLIPQDPNDEPASILLGRIMAEKAGRAKRTKGSKINGNRQMRLIND